MWVVSINIIPSSSCSNSKIWRITSTDSAIDGNWLEKLIKRMNFAAHNAVQCGYLQKLTKALNKTLPSPLLCFLDCQGKESLDHEHGDRCTQWPINWILFVLCHLPDGDSSMCTENYPREHSFDCRNQLHYSFNIFYISSTMLDDAIYIVRKLSIED